MSTGPANIYCSSLPVWGLVPSSPPPPLLLKAIFSFLSRQQFPLMGEESEKSKTVGQSKVWEPLGGSWRETEWLFRLGTYAQVNLPCSPCTKPKTNPDYFAFSSCDQSWVKVYIFFRKRLFSFKICVLERLAAFLSWDFIIPKSQNISQRNRSLMWQLLKINIEENVFSAVKSALPEKSWQLTSCVKWMCLHEMTPSRSPSAPFVLWGQGASSSPLKLLISSAL